MANCPHCGFSGQDPSSTHCERCGKPMLIAPPLHPVIPEIGSGTGLLPIVLNIFGVLSIIGGIIWAILLWPRADYTLGILTPRRNYAPSLIAIIGGVINGCIFWALADLVRNVRELVNRR